MPDTGIADLHAGRWDEARAHFEAELERAETPEALEGLGLALRFGNEFDRGFEANERAYLLYRERNDPRGAARIATRLARDNLIVRGESAIAGGWLARAERLLEDLPACPERGWLALRKGQVAYYGLGKFDPGIELGAEAEHLGREAGDVDLEMCGMALRGLALVARGDVDEGMRCLDEAATAAVAGEVRWLDAAGAVCCDLIFACELVGDVARAAQWTGAANSIAGRGGLRSLLGVCRTHHATLMMLEGRWEEAEAEFDTALADFDLTARGMAHEGKLRLAELRRRQRRYEEALALCAEVAWSPRSLLVQARVALDRGDPARALDLLGQFRAIQPDDCVAAAPALELAVRAHLESGALDAARDAAAALAAVVERCGTPALGASRELTRGRIETAAGNFDAGRQALERALASYLNAGAPYEAALARLDLAAALDGAGDSRAPRERAAAEAELVRLGAAGSGTGLLTPRELEVLRHVADGQSDDAIAERLVISPHTVHRHVANIRAKLGQSSRTAAVAEAARAGLI